MGKPNEVQGLEGLDDALKRLGPAVAFRVLRTTLRKTLQPMIATMRSLAEVGTGALRESIGIVFRKNPNDSGITAVIGPRPRDKKALALARRARPWLKGIFYAHIVELGRAGGRGTPPAPAKPFMRPGYDITVGDFLRNFANAARDEILKAARRARRAAESKKTR